MGFFNDLGKALMGTNSSPGAKQQEMSPAQQEGIVDESGRKIIPDIELKDLQSRRDGDKLTVMVWVQNNSDQQIRIDTCYLLKQNRQFNQIISPHGSHQLTLYQGPAPRDENERQARIVYRLQVNGDTFQNHYRIDYHLESDGVRTIDYLHDDGPVRDI